MAKRKKKTNDADKVPEMNRLGELDELIEQESVQEARDSGTEEPAEPTEKESIEVEIENQEETNTQEHQKPAWRKLWEAVRAPASQGGAEPPSEPKTPPKLLRWIRKQTLNIKCAYFTLANRTYRYFYFVGLQLLRSTRTRRRHFMHALRAGEQRLARSHEQRQQRLNRHFKDIWREIREPFTGIKLRYAGFVRELRNARQYGGSKRMRQVCLEMAEFLGRGLLRVLKFLFNYIAPIAGCVALFITVNYFNNLTLALQVDYNGVDVGCITDESVFTQAENDMKERMILGDIMVADPTLEDQVEAAQVAEAAEEVVKPKPVIPQFKLQVIDEQQLTTVDELTNKLILASGKNANSPDVLSIEQADGLYIDGTYVGAVTDGSALLITMNDMLEEFHTSEMDESTKIQFVKKVEVKQGLYPASTIRPLEDIATILNKEERGKRIYTVVSGDTPLRIAAKNGISFDELKLLNPEVDVSLFPGDELLISQSVPYLGVKVTTMIEYEEEVAYQIKQQTNPDQDIGWTKVMQKGEDGLRKITAEVVMIDGIETERTIVNRDILKAPVEQIIQVGGNKPLKFIPSSSNGSLPSGAFAWPAAAGSITTSFLGYYGHTGADITFRNCTGTPVYASADGTVVASGWGGMYGNRIILNHGGDVQTLYAHCSKLVVVPGQQVAQGDVIGYIGRTGNVTGPHLHFEIRVNGTPRNPAPYLYG